MTLIVSFDPGPSECGYAIVAPVGRRARYVIAGMVTSSVDGIMNVLRFGNVERVVIERPRGYIHATYRGPTLLDTAFVAGLIEGIARSIGLEVRSMSAEQWRRALTGSATATDAVIEGVVRPNVIGMPRVSNPHSRDSLGLAVFACWCASTGQWPQEKVYGRAKGKRVA